MAIDLAGSSFEIYLVLDHGIAKVIGGDDMLAGVGRFVLRTTGGVGEARAKRLLDWVRGDVDKATSPQALAFKRVWGSGVPASREAMLLAAAVLAGGSDPDRVIPVGVRCASTLPEAVLVCHEVLLSAYLAGERWADAMAQIEAILALRPDRAGTHARLHALVLAHTGRFDEADHLLDDALAKEPDNRGAMIARVMVATIRGDVSEALRRADAIAHDSKVTPGELNDIAWFRLGAGRDLPVALQLARRAVQEAKDSAAEVNTLAAIEAELGDLDRAVADNWRAMALSPSAEPQGADWYVAGRIDEQLGLTADAITAYQHVPMSHAVWPSAYDLAQKRLAAIHAVP